MIMMDPMRIDVAVSAETARALGVDDTVNLLLQGSETPRRASVLEIATAADPKTRTFRVSLFARNLRRLVGIPADDPRQKATRIARIMVVSREDFGSGVGPMYVEENRALRKDDQGYFVWHIQGHADREGIKTGTMLPVEKVRVTPGDSRVQRQGIFLFRELKDTGGLAEGAIVAFDLPADFSGKEVLLAQKEWILKPGQVVTAVLATEVPHRGIYVPMSSVSSRTQDEGVIFVVVDETARRVSIRIHDSLGAYFRVEGADEASAKLLVSGSRIILDYVHFLEDGEPVKVTRTVKAPQ